MMDWHIVEGWKYNDNYLVEKEDCIGYIKKV